jgi:hypothetical protein
MGGEGSILSMIISLKNNARLRKDSHERWKSDKNYRYKTNKPLEFKKVSKEELAEVIARNRKKAKQERRIQLVVTIVVFLLLLFGISKLFTQKGENIIEAQQRKKQERINEYKSETEKDKRIEEEHLMYLLNDGYMWLDKKHYKNARTQFYNAYMFKPNDFRVKLANSRLFVTLCVEMDNNCHVAERMVEELKEKYIHRVEVKDLIEFYEGN